MIQKRAGIRFNLEQTQLNESQSKSEVKSYVVVCVSLSFDTTWFKHQLRLKSFQPARVDKVVLWLSANGAISGFSLLTFVFDCKRLSCIYPQDKCVPFSFSLISSKPTGLEETEEWYGFIFKYGILSNTGGEAIRRVMYRKCWVECV